MLYFVYHVPFLTLALLCWHADIGQSGHTCWHEDIERSSTTCWHADIAPSGLESVRPGVCRDRCQATAEHRDPARHRRLSAGLTRQGV